MRSAPTISFEYRPSRRLLAALLAVTVLAVVAVLLSGLPGWPRLALLTLLLVGSAVEARRLMRSAWLRAGWQDTGEWRLLGADGTEHRAELASARVLGRWIVLRLRREHGRAAALVLGPDNAGGDLRRRLRMRLSASSDTD